MSTARRPSTHDRDLMHRLSEANWWTWKCLVPSVCLGFCGFMVASALLNAPGKSWGPILIFVGAVFVMWRLYWSKVEEVYDCGDSILVRSGSRQAVIPLAAISSVRLIAGRTPYIRIDLKETTPFGDRIDFFDGTRPALFRRVQASDGVQGLMARIRRLDASSS